jgi:hypothetical protein
VTGTGRRAAEATRTTTSRPNSQKRGHAGELKTYLNFNGQCATAFKFYEKCLSGKIVMMQTPGDSPMKDQVAPDWQDKRTDSLTICIG